MNEKKFFNPRKLITFPKIYFLQKSQKINPNSLKIAETLSIKEKILSNPISEITSLKIYFLQKSQ